MPTECILAPDLNGGCSHIRTRADGDAVRFVFPLSPEPAMCAICSMWVHYLWKNLHCAGTCGLPTFWKLYSFCNLKRSAYYIWPLTGQSFWSFDPRRCVLSNAVESTPNSV